MDKKSDVRVCKCFAHEGYLVFNINYRLAPAAVFPEQFQDVGNAVSWVFASAKEYGGDNRKIFLAGDSAGAYFAAMYAAAAGKEELARALSIRETIPPESLRGLILFYGAYDMDTVLHTGFKGIKFMAEGFLGKDPLLYRERAQSLLQRGTLTRATLPRSSSRAKGTTCTLSRSISTGRSPRWALRTGRSSSTGHYTRRRSTVS